MVPALGKGMEKKGMKSLPSSERPYEKCWESGASVLTDAELLAVILRTGSRGESALELSRSLLSIPGAGGLTGLYHLTARQLTKIRGIGKVKAIQLLCITELSRRIARERARTGLCFDHPDSVINYYMEELRHEDQEKVMTVLLDRKGRLLGEETVAVGSACRAAVTPREIFLSALKYRAVSFVLLHNHPSGDPAPSREDILLTRSIREAGELLGIELLDHIVIGDHKAVSFRRDDLF